MTIYTEIREVWDNLDSDLWLSLEDHEELERDGKKIVLYNEIYKRELDYKWHFSNT
jgi:hypothetical protein